MIRMAPFKKKVRSSARIVFCIPLILDRNYLIGFNISEEFDMTLRPFYYNRINQCYFPQAKMQYGFYGRQKTAVQGLFGILDLSSIVMKDYFGPNSLFVFFIPVEPEPQKVVFSHRMILSGFVEFIFVHEGLLIDVVHHIIQI